MTKPLIYTQISLIMKEIGAVGKNSQNVQQHYKFRSADDIANKLQPLLAKHEVTIIPEVLDERSEEKSSRSGATLIYRILKVRYTFFASDGSSMSAVTIGEGMDSGDKASNKAMTAAWKYAVCQTFCIRTEDQADSEYESPEVGASFYQGTTDQKLKLIKILKEKNLISADLQKKIHAELLTIDVKMPDLSLAIDSLLKKGIS